MRICDGSSQDISKLVYGSKWFATRYLQDNIMIALETLHISRKRSAAKQASNFELSSIDVPVPAGIKYQNTVPRCAPSSLAVVVSLGMSRTLAQEISKDKCQSGGNYRFRTKTSTST